MIYFVPRIGRSFVSCSWSQKPSISTLNSITTISLPHYHSFNHNNLVFFFNFLLIFAFSSLTCFLIPRSLISPRYLVRFKILGFFSLSQPLISLILFLNFLLCNHLQSLTKPNWIIINFYGRDFALFVFSMHFTLVFNVYLYFTMIW